MAPSRGLRAFLGIHSHFGHPLRRRYSNFSQLVANPSRKSQVYVSRTSDPYVNLSIEHFLLQKSPEDSTVLFLYTNRPCVVIGRNQNPWVEVNLGLLNNSSPLHGSDSVGTVDLVRRRSGGGTVFHDEGNVNYSVICPTSVFNRDKHAQMVVMALQELGVTNARVNERHDIVLDPGGDNSQTSSSEEKRRPLKVSGSAYKLTRLRSVHHGTCLLSSPNLANISQYLRSPAKPYIKARGVDSVSSPITNINVSNAAFEEAVINEFGQMHDFDEPVVVTGEECQIPEIAKGLAELISLDWIYLQTPQFTFSSQKTDDDRRERPRLPDAIPLDVSISFTARNGAITTANFDSGGVDMLSDKSRKSMSLLDKKVHMIEDWRDVFPQPLNETSIAVTQWLNGLFGRRGSGD